MRPGFRSMRQLPILPFNRLISPRFSGVVEFLGFGKDFDDPFSEALEKAASIGLSDVTSEHL